MVLVDGFGFEVSIEVPLGCAATYFILPARASQGMRQGNPGRARRRPQAASGKGEIGIVDF